MSTVLLSRLCAGVAILAALGTPLRQDGYSFRPPEEFRKMRTDLFAGTWAGAPAVDVNAQRYLSAALVDGESESAVSILVATVDGTFDASPGTRDAFSSAVVKHFADEIGMPISIERVDLVRGAAPRVEVVGTIRQEDQLRRVLIAGMQGQGRHAVITISAPTGRFDALEPVLRESLESFRVDAPSGDGVSRNVAGSVAAVVGLGLFVSWWMWRRRVRMRRAESGLAP